MNRLQDVVFVADPVQVAYFLAASRDRNAIHVSQQAAEAAGLAGPIIPGPFGAAHAYLAAARAYGIQNIRAVTASFRGPLGVGDEVRLTFGSDESDPVGCGWQLTGLGAERPAVTGTIEWVDGSC